MALRLGEAFAFFHGNSRMPLPGRWLAAGEYQVRAPCSEGFGGFISHAVVGSGYDDPFQCQVGPGDVLLGEECAVGSSQAL